MSSLIACMKSPYSKSKGSSHIIGRPILFKIQNAQIPYFGPCAVEVSNAIANP